MEPSTERLKSDELLDEVKRALHEKDVVDVEEERVKIVVFRSGGIRYAFYGSDIREILPPREIFWVPSLPACLPGLINVRGDIESVIDIRHFLGGEQTDVTKCLIAIAVRGDFRSGILIDSVEDVLDLPLSSIKPPLSSLGGVARELAAGEIELGEQTATLLNIDMLAAKVTL
ncbi:MAG: hypothetical protein A2051_07105 [Desulfovibrionales bacterium GWA2_65_9]|nr:MAG: hypothetical protein A2051_07105 [Desulfovibrionales bacterium GWA2_65_9]